MCEDHSPPPAPPPVLYEVEARQPIPVESADSVEITTLMDNVTDVFMPDQGPGRRYGPPRRAVPCPVMAGEAGLDALVAEHGFPC